MTGNTILPWHAENWQQLTEARNADRLPHGVLLRGPAGLGKGRFAAAMAAYLLCQERGASACGHCRSCVLLAGGNHPDFFHLRPDEDKTQIRVEQIRGLIGKLVLASQMQGYKAVIIEPADGMNLNAQNSLLKTLEEPPRQTVLFLVSSHPAGLAPTVLSRCQVLRFGCPPAAVALDWLAGQGEADWPVLLKLAWGAPLAAVDLARHDAAGMGETLAADLVALMTGRTDAVSMAERWTGDHPQLRLRWLQQQLYGLIQWQALGEPPELVHKTLQRSLQNRVPDLSLTESYRYLDRLEYVIGLADRAVNQTLSILPLLNDWADGPRFQQTGTK